MGWFPADREFALREDFSPEIKLVYHTLCALPDHDENIVIERIARICHMRPALIGEHIKTLEQLGMVYSRRVSAPGRRGYYVARDLMPIERWKWRWQFSTYRPFEGWAVFKTAPEKRISAWTVFSAKENPEGHPLPERISQGTSFFPPEPCPAPVLELPKDLNKEEKRKPLNPNMDGKSYMNDRQVSKDVVTRIEAGLKSASHIGVGRDVFARVVDLAKSLEQTLKDPDRKVDFAVTNTVLAELVDKAGWSEVEEFVSWAPNLGYRRVKLPWAPEAWEKRIRKSWAMFCDREKGEIIGA